MRILAALLTFVPLLGGCASIPAQLPYDPSCFEASLPVGVPYPVPRDALETVFARPQLNPGTGKGSADAGIVTVRRTGPYSESEFQFSIIESWEGALRAELIEPEHCSVDDQLHAMYVADQTTTEAERLATVRLRKTLISESEFPRLRELHASFLKLKVSTDLRGGITFHQRTYSVWAETLLEELYVHVGEGQKELAVWAESAFLELHDFAESGASR